MKSKKIRLRYLCETVLLVSLLLSAPTWGYDKEIDALSSVMAEKIARKGKKAIAVVNFTDLEGNVTQLDQFIAEEFSMALAGAGKGFRVIDRTYLQSIIKKHKLFETGLIDPETARKLGKIAGVDALVTGTLIPFGDNVRLAVKVLDTETADIIDSAKINFPKTIEINELLGSELFKDSFVDNFNEGNQLDWKMITGKWVIENGKYTVANIKKEENYISTIKNRGWNNFIFSVDVAPGYISRALYRASVCPRVINSNNFLCLGIEGRRNKFNKIYWYIGKNGEHVSSHDIDTNTGEPIQVRIEVKNGVYIAYINGNESSSVYDNSFLSGEIGLAQWYELWDYDKIKIEFDNASIIPLFK